MPARLCRAIAQSAMQKTAGAMSEDVPLFPRRRTGGEWVEVTTLPHHQQAMPRNRAKRDAKTAGAQSEDVPLYTRRRTGGEWVEVATLPHRQQAIAAQSRKAQCKKQPERRALRPQARFGAQPPQAALGAEIGCSSVHPPPNRRRMGGGSNLALALGGEGLTLPHCQQPIAAPGNPLTHNHATPHQKEGQPC